jgi:hypothetical protein
MVFACVAYLAMREYVADRYYEYQDARRKKDDGALTTGCPQPMHCRIVFDRLLLAHHGILYRQRWG